MKIFLKFLSAIIITLACGCTGKHLITSKEYLAVVEKAFNERKQLAVNRKTELFSIFDRDLSVKQTEALRYLYAFMPLSDLADYNGDFFLANVDYSLRSESGTPWGKNIPEEIFLHYVLPCRINNENLDSFRIVYYDEIMDRVKGKDMREAALEINHWCHEKVSYQPADIRTSAPMSTILSARGRCGEESTFAVAALRTAGIPARQVYTPRWAHSDDNHAWVEIWDNGDWYYMGACEPEPVLDRGWFTEPARRAMLVHTKSFGASSGNENTINQFRNYSIVNNLAKYAITKKICVRVVDSGGMPLQNAEVEYQLYNYAEFYPLAVVPTDENGISQFETGLGDLLVWAHKGDDFDFRKISVSETDTLFLQLDQKADGISETGFDLDLGVPVVRTPFPSPSPGLMEENSKRITDENILRQKYIDSWIKPGDTKSLALKLGLDTAEFMHLISRSMGNYKEIISFFEVTPDSLKNLAVSMLEILPDKDLRDGKGSVFSDHLMNCVKPNASAGENEDYIFLNYVLNPRIANELISDWRSYFREKLPSLLVKNSLVDPSVIVQYLNENITIANNENYYKTLLTPGGVIDLKIADEGSRSICFVAICRSMGIPARLEPGSNVPQYFFSNIWNDVFFADQEQPVQKKGYIKLVSEETMPVPEYYIHFTLARFDKGRYNTLEYDFNKKISDFKEDLVLPPGNYMLVTGNRLSDSRILSHISFLTLSAGEHKIVEVKLRKDSSIGKILGKIDLTNVTGFFDENKEVKDIIKDKGVVIVWIEPDKEPTKHIFNDLPLLKKELDDWGGFFLFLSDSLEPGSGFKPETLKGLPANSLFGTDNKLSLLKDIIKTNSLSGGSLPYIVLSDKNGNILFTSTGYRIGIGEIILKKLLTTVDIRK